ncbi:type II toxin-antitoxin system VapC family toxin [Halococcus agarilyticus]|uniref:type II toxin-antitoxin system VapC family toxin n=1 Tax=Halococcus agarilyticus TaxID=1232219 RepID=UPI000A8A0B9D|nr:VapC toxin family PIN domain ribonuclease [Halococcus agarilyticus]
MADARLFDASSIVELLIGKSGDGVPADVLFDEHTLDLTFYEAGNALWKLAVARDDLSDASLQDAMALLASLRREAVVETVIGPGFVDVSQTAREEGLTFYDAAYLHIARRNSLELITEDSALRDAAGQYVSVGRVAALGD